MLVIRDTRDVARLASGEALQDVERGFGRTPFREHFAAAPVMREQAEDVEVGERLAWCAGNFLGQADAALAAIA